MPVETVVAVARQESGLNPYAIRNERTRTSHFPATLAEAEALATRFEAEGVLIGVGLMQLTPPRRFGLTIREALNPCRNMKAGAELLAANYRLAVREMLSRYNSGHPTRSEGYALSVEALAQRPPLLGGPALPVAPPAPSGPPPPLAVTSRRGSGREIAFTPANRS
jgi:type IV secretion system protein VirB1